MANLPPLHGWLTRKGMNSFEADVEHSTEGRLSLEFPLEKLTPIELEFYHSKVRDGAYLTLYFDGARPRVEFSREVWTAAEIDAAKQRAAELATCSGTA